MADFSTLLRDYLQGQQEANRPLRFYLWNCPSLPPPWAAREAEEAGREAWIAGVQKRLGLVTRENVDELLAVRLEKLYG